MAIRLTDKFCENAKGDPAKRLEHADAIVPGLFFVVQPTGKRSWAVRYRDAAKKPVKVTLGAFPLTSLGDARMQGREVLDRVARGHDVAAEKRVNKTITFTEAPSRDRLWPKVVETFLLREAGSLRSRDTVEAILKRETADRWAGKLIGDISKRDVIALVDSIVDRGSPVAANRALAWVKRVFGWAVSRDLVASNPCIGIRPQPEKSRDRVLSRSELSDIWAVANDMGYPFGQMLRLLIVSGQRLREVAEAEWREFDIDGGSWEIPAARAKNDERHLCPLSPAALALLKELPRLGKPATFVFTTTTTSPVSGFARAKQSIDKKLRELDLQRAKEVGQSADSVPAREPWVLHDIRRTVATGMAELGILADIVERVLNHKGQSRTGIRAVYQKFEHLPERRDAMLRWGAEVERIVGIAPAVADNVHELRVVG